MITYTVKRRYGTATVRTRVTAPSIEQALELCGEQARIVFPIEPKPFFAPKGAAEVAEPTAQTAA
ncbi:MAG: hypothetical protein ACREVJ_03120 [Gammaproteobacteria bacterium]